MALSEYMQAGEVRAALGVTTKELPDDVISLPMYENVLIKEAGSVSSTCLSDFRAVDNKSPSARTEAEANFHLALSLFAVFAVARQLTVSLPLFSPKMIGDGKALTSRYSDSPYKQTIAAVQASYDEYREYLKETFAIFGGGSQEAIAPIALVAVMSPATDPVTEG